jgi:hypothetical protein
VTWTQDMVARNPNLQAAGTGNKVWFSLAVSSVAFSPPSLLLLCLRSDTNTTLKLEACTQPPGKASHLTDHWPLAGLFCSETQMTRTPTNSRFPVPARKPKLCYEDRAPRTRPPRTSPRQTQTQSPSPSPSQRQRQRTSKPKEGKALKETPKPKETPQGITERMAEGIAEGIAGLQDYLLSR